MSWLLEQLVDEQRRQECERHDEALRTDAERLRQKALRAATKPRPWHAHAPRRGQAKAGSTTC